MATSVRKTSDLRAPDVQARGVRRTMAVLEALNLQNGSSVKHLQQCTALSRPAIYRILNGLIASGFVAEGRIAHTYVLTSKVRALSSGFTDDNLIAELAAPILDALQQKVIWPTELATLRNVRMQLRDTTRHRSPMVIDGEVVGQSIPVLKTALGLAFLSRCSAPCRRAIVDHLRQTSRASDAPPSDRRLKAMLDAVRSTGYASREGGLIEGAKYNTSTIAVAIAPGEIACAAIAITFFSTAMSVQKAAATYLDDLQRAARALEKQLEKAKYAQA